jgi:hypothetical protein
MYYFKFYYICQKDILMTTKSFEVYGDDTSLHKKVQFQVFAKDTCDARKIIIKTHPWLVIELVYPSIFYSPQ